tara:strand:- start:78 stop:587 length:510 start_codon:yes stop_codon:yes gene_type:complete
MFNIIQDISGNLLKHATKTYAFRDTKTIDRIVVHQTDSADQGKFSAYNVANYHVNTNNWAGIGYHYFITDDGSVYQTNQDDVVSYHASGYNNRSLSVAITGDHVCSSGDDNYDVISKEKYNALVFVLAKISNQYNIPSESIIGHNETGSPKPCPNLNLEQLRSDVKKKD